MESDSKEVLRGSGSTEESLVAMFGFCGVRTPQRSTQLDRHSIAASPLKQLWKIFFMLLKAIIAAKRFLWMQCAKQS